MTDEFKFYSVKITGIAKAVPETVITNEDLAKIVDTNDEWITARTGIKKRHIVTKDETLSDLAYNAAQEAIDFAGIKPEEIDLIITATSIPDNFYPTVSCEVQKKLGIAGCPSFDLAAACSGFIYGLNVAKNFIATGQCKKVLLIGADIHSRFVDWTDRSTCVLFGDGAGAMILERSENDENDILAVNIHADGEKSDKLRIPVKGKNCPLVEPNEIKQQILSMDGREVYKFAVNIVPASIEEALKQAELDINDIDYFVLHQANIRILDAAAERLGVSEEKLIRNIQDYGNTSAASIPIVLADTINDGRIKTPAIVALSGFGAGLTWGSAIIKLRLEDKRGKNNG